MEGLTREMNELYAQEFYTSPTKLKNFFNQLLMIRGMYTDNRLAETFIMAGQTAIAQENWPGLVNVIQQLHGLIPPHMINNSGSGEGDGRGIDLGKIGFQLFLRWGKVLTTTKYNSV